jgi:hypothetical protein
MRFYVVHVVQALPRPFRPPLALVFLFYAFVELAQADASHAALPAVRAASFGNLFEAGDSADGFADGVGPDGG